MSSITVFKSVHPIGDTDPHNLPVPSLETALPYYRNLGFNVQIRDGDSLPKAIMTRDAIEMGLVENGGDPEQASCYIEVSDVEIAHQEMADRGARPSDLRIDRYGENAYRVFFVKDDVGLCYCLGQKQQGDG